MTRRMIRRGFELACLLGPCLSLAYAEDPCGGAGASDQSSEVQPAEREGAELVAVTRPKSEPTIPIFDGGYDGVLYSYFTSCCDPIGMPEQHHYGFVSFDNPVDLQECSRFYKDGRLTPEGCNAFKYFDESAYRYKFVSENVPRSPAGKNDPNLHTLSFRGGDGGGGPRPDLRYRPYPLTNSKTGDPVPEHSTILMVRFVGGRFDRLREEDFLLFRIPVRAEMRSEDLVYDGGNDEERIMFLAVQYREELYQFDNPRIISTNIMLQDPEAGEPGPTSKNQRSTKLDGSGEGGALYVSHMNVRNGDLRGGDLEDRTFSKDVLIIMTDDFGTRN